MRNLANGKVLTPSDTVDHNFDAFYIGGAGNVNIMGTNQKTFLLTAPTPNVIHQIGGRRIMAASTTATLIVGLYL